MTEKQPISEEIALYLSKLARAEKLAQTDNPIKIMKLLGEYREGRFKKLFAQPSLQCVAKDQEVIQQQMAMAELIKEGKMTARELRDLRHNIGLLSDSDPSIITFNADGDYNRSVQQMIDDCGFDYVDEDVTPGNFPILTRPSGNRDFYLFSFQYAEDCEPEDVEFDTDYEFILDRLEQNGCKPADLADLLVFAEKFPDIQRRNSIMALNSLWQKDIRGQLTTTAPIIDDHNPGVEPADDLALGKERCLGVFPIDEIDLDSDNILAVPK